LTDETRHAIGAPELALMKPTAILVNTARGKVVDEGALVVALAEERIAAAGLDVFENEPKLHAALETLSNVVLAPHVGSATTETRLRMAKLAAENLAEMLAGRRPANVVNPQVFEA
jgi:lactate dehydrogenase-like 2-hydroxyacid dehydrogenase